MKFSDLKTVEITSFYKWPGGLPIILPFVGYVLFGLANIYFFSTAIKQIPTAMAFAVWTAATLILLKVSEVAFFHSRIAFAEIFFMLLIMIGILGLKIYAAPAK
jgi:quaternary ammonium compound-resistance protein SugE